MKTTATVMGLSNLDHSKDFMNGLREIYPECKRERSFSIAHVDEDDQRLVKILEYLKKAGMTPWQTSGKRNKKTEYTYIRFRDYELSDFEGLDWLRLYPHAQTPAGYRTDGRLELRLTDFNRDADIAAADGGWYVVPERVKQLFEASDLKGLLFRPAALIEGYHTSKEYFDMEAELGETWWELTSDIVLPPLSETLELGDSRGRPLEDRHDFSKGVYPHEGFFAAPELRYDRSVMDAMPAFDLAKTYEPLGIKPEYDQRYLIASKRFRDFCDANDITTQWQPVRIEEDR